MVRVPGSLGSFRPSIRLVLAVSMTVATTGCIRFSRRGDSKATERPAVVPDSNIPGAQRDFPHEYELLKEAENALAENPARTILLVDETLQSLRAKSPVHRALDHSRAQLWSGAYLLGSMAHMTNRPEDVLGFWGVKGWSMSCKNILPELGKRCAAFKETILSKLPHLIEYDAYSGVYRIKTTVGGSSLSKASLLVEGDKKVRAALQEKVSSLGARFTPTSVKTMGNTLLVSVDGETSQSHIKKCRDTGVDVRIGRTDFDLKRCYKKGFTSYGAHFRVELPATPDLEVQPGDTLYVFFEPKNYIVAGNQRTIRDARLAFVEHAQQ